MFCLSILIFAATILPASNLAAQQVTSPADTVPTYILEGLIVTTTRSTALRSETPQQISVVTAMEMKRSPGEELADVLKKEVPLSVIQFPGLLAGVSIRGFRPQFSGINPRTLILVNGRPAGTSNLAMLDLAAVERIEVMKGPASALYGSSAMGGVVNVITRQSGGPVTSTISAGYGSFDTYEANLTSGGNLSSRLNYDLSLSIFERADDYRIGSTSLFNDGTVVKVFADGTREIADELKGDTVRDFTEYGTRSGSVRLGYELNRDWRADVRAGAFIADGVQSPGDANAPWDGRGLKDLERYTGEVSLDGEIDRHRISARAYATDETAAYYNAPLEPNFINFRTPTLTYGAQLQDALSIGAHTITAGFDYSAVSAESESFTDAVTRGAPYSPNSGTTSAAPFAEARLSLLDERVTMTLGGRLDYITFQVEDGELFDGSAVASTSESYTVFNPSFGLQYLGKAGVRVHTSGGRAFVTPDAFNVAGYSELAAGPANVAVTRGNRAVEPENSFTWDVGIGIVRPESGLEADLTYFDTSVRDRITTRRTLPEEVQLTASGDTIRSITTYVNADRAEIRGLEASLAYDLGALADFSYSLRLFANASRILQAEEISGSGAAVSVDGIRNVADLTVNYGLRYDDLNQFSAAVTGRYVGERLDTDFTDFANIADVRYPPFMVVDLSTNIRLGDRYGVGLFVTNVTDENYYEVRGYNLPGRAFKVRLSVDL
ncbi:MAG TPA: TonB-dependent receptor [Longimicrobiaceae bacterium]|nr:TonB-dependent receptor [Longimicrobiaceae bacterium]